MSFLPAKILFIILYLYTSSVWTQSHNDKGLEKVSLQLKWHNQFQFAGYYVAKYKGYYQAAGLDVELMEGGPDANYEQILSGSANFGVADSRILLARMEGKPVVALAAIFQHTPDAIVSLSDKKLSLPSHFINKKIMLAENTIPPALQAIFYKEGIPLNALLTVPNEKGIESVLNRKVDALIGYVTNEPFQIELNGIKTNVISPNDFGIDSMEIYFTLQNWKQINIESGQMLF